MRKYHKRLILDLLRSIEEEQTNGRYAEAKYGVNVIIKFINENVGKDTEVVVLLDEYLFLLSQAQVGRIAEEKIRRHSMKVENAVRSELKGDKIEVVFLSYKEAMSDAIESIYFAAKADPDCKAIWMPIPYFERNADGSFGVMHYEGAGDCGEGREQTDWRVYDIEANHPDIIFTFAPYDGKNYVTSIHPNFYCERLRGLTDMLVYVPYFVNQKYGVAEHLCIVQGCVYAHKVVVESEEVRDTYVRVFRKVYGDCYGSPEDKFVALGSPKFDKVLKTRREDCELPGRWKEIIGDKKVILYNTTLEALLIAGKRYLEQLRFVIGTVRGREDVVLWWRPHPLLENTLKSMHPELLEEYRMIVEEAKEASNLIFDDTSDLHRAIAMSDAYYGDSSSVVALYEKTGKPLTLQSIGNSLFSSYYFQIHDGNIYFISTDNVLMKIDMTYGSVDALCVLEETTAYLSHYGCCNVGHLIFCSPFYSDRIVIFDELKQSMELIDLKKEFQGISAPYFSSVIRFNDYLYFLPINFPGILEMKIEDKTFKIYFERDKVPYDGLAGEHIYNRPKGRWFVYGSKLMVACDDCNRFLEFDMEYHTWNVQTIGNSKDCYLNVLFDGVRYWFLGYKRSVLTVLEGTESLSVQLPNHRGQGETDSYHWLYDRNGFIYVIPLRERCILKVNKQTLAVTETNFLSDYFAQCKEGVNVFWASQLINDTIVLFPTFRNAILFINVSDGSIWEVALSENYSRLEYFIECLSDARNDAAVMEGTSAGENIYSFIKNKVLEKEKR